VYGKNFYILKASVFFLFFFFYIFNIFLIKCFVGNDGFIVHFHKFQDSGIHSPTFDLHITHYSPKYLE